MAEPESSKNLSTIRVHNPSLNRNAGMYNLHHIYGTESHLRPQNLELANITGMHIEHTSVGILRPSHPISKCIEQ